MRGHVELGGDVVAVRVGDHRGALDGTLVGAGVGALGGRGQAGDDVLHAVELEDVGLEPGHRLLLAAVGGGARLGLHLDCVLLGTVGDGEVALLVSDVVIPLEVSALERGRRRDGAIAGTNQGLGTGVGAPLDALAHGEGARGHLKFRRGERGAVVRFLGIDRLKRDVALGYLNVRRGFQGRGSIPNGYINLHLNRIRTRIFVLGCDIAPRFTVIGAVLNCALLNEFLSLVLILLSKIASLVDGDIDRRKAMLFAVISIFIAGYIKACPQRVKGVSLSTVVNIGNGVAGFLNGGRLISTFLVKPTNKRLARGSGFALGYLDGVTLCKTIVVVPLLLAIGNSVCGGGDPCSGRVGKIVANFALLRCIVERHFLRNAPLNDYRRWIRLNVGIPLDRNLIV